MLKVIDRGRFAASVARHRGDRYAKSFSSWDHLVLLAYGQLSGADSLRAMEAGWNAHGHHHYHLGVGPIRRSTLADANQRRPPAIFAEVFAQLNGAMGRQLRREGTALVRLIDSTPIPLPDLCGWADWNGRTHGLKMHMVYDPGADHPRHVEITPASVNDIVVGRKIEPERGAT
jgi:putative transposase